MTDLSLTILLLGTFAAGICIGASVASFAYARRYRALRLAAWGERMMDEVQASPSRYLSDEDEAAFRGRLSGRSRPASERFRP